MLHDGELEDDADGEEDAVHGHEAQPVQLAGLEPAQRQHREGEPEADAEAGRQHQGHLGALCSTQGALTQTQISIEGSSLPSGMEALPSCRSWMVKGSPIPSSRLNSGPPKQALKPARGEPRLYIRVSSIYLSTIYRIYQGM